MSQSALLTLTPIGKQFPGVRALDDGNLDVRAGAVHALRGEKRTGQSALIKTLSSAVSAMPFEVSPTSAVARLYAADNLPVSPLVCASETSAAVPAAMDNDGGQAVAAPDKAGQPITPVNISGLINIGCFAATTEGMRQAAQEPGDVNSKTNRLTEANIDDPITFPDNFINQRVDGLLFAASDPVAIAPVRRTALEKGIHVVGHGTNAGPDAREWFGNQAGFNGIGKSMRDSIIAEIGEDGSFAIVTSTFTTPNQARWIAEMQAGQETCNSNAKWLETVEAQKDNILSFNQADTLINQYGDEPQALSGMTSAATPASAEAVRKLACVEQLSSAGSLRQLPRSPMSSPIALSQWYCGTRLIWAARRSM